jgi:predicted dehydrogenase
MTALSDASVTVATAATDLRPVSVALVGHGYWGRNLARNLAAADNISLVRVVDPDESARRAAARAFPTAQISRNVESVLADPEVEGVVLATAAGSHASLATAALEAGKHVLVEKPLATTVEDGEALVALALRAQRVLMVGHTFLHATPVRRLREYVETRVLGNVQYLYSQRLSLGKIRRDCNALWNFGPHDVAIMLYLLDDRPVEVSARSFSFIGEGVDDVFFCSMQFSSGIGGNFHVSWIDPRKARLVTVVGDRKMAVYDDVSVDQKIQLVDAGLAGGQAPLGHFESLGDFQWRTRVGDIVIPHIEMSEPLLREVTAFGRACRGVETPLTDGQHGLDVVRVLSALDESAARRGAPVEITW